MKFRIKRSEFKRVDGSLKDKRLKFNCKLEFKERIKDIIIYQCITVLKDRLKNTNVLIII